ncbi:ABC transporter ATP-binding protein [Propioniciclava sinopodophylli]|uniref:ABC transporter ATP-binding protein n=1 Tax=Propioniciclava sinopodophylli TaxID=1837344 RepID=A0A4Q9KH81_9ACTN|nr:ABC transporter ATP-binding protein [Propioniciclava sinopodophylli]TBT88719.1 ABC transporter ATP-binding protein [Propioniciclava sinopodophylli]
MRTLLRVLSTARELWPWYAGIIATSVFVAATALATPFIIARATDEVVAQASGGGGGLMVLVALAGALLVAELLNTVLTNVGGYLGDTMTMRLRAILSSRYYAKLLSLPQRYFENQLTGTVINKLHRSITEVTQFLQMFSNSFFPTLITVFAVLGISLYYSWPLALLLLIIYPLFTWLTALTSKRWQVLEGEKNDELDAAGGRFAEVIGQIKVTKSFVRERTELDTFDGHYRRAVATTNTQSSWWHRMDVARRGSLNIIFFGIYLIIFAQTASGIFTLGDMVLLIQLVAMARTPVMMMSFLVDSSQHAIAGSKSYFEVMDETPEPFAAVGEIRSPDLSPTATTGGAAPAASAWPVVPDAPTIAFDGVSFGYDSHAEVLHDITFDVARGERLALVSESGGGKTTLVNLLLGLYSPSAGTISIAGTDTASVSLAQVRSQIGVVFQDASLFSGTVRENLSYGRPGATDAELEQAARRANAHDFIAKLSDGYDTVIGERGVRLSGGQKQRIAVARAMVKDAPLLVLDEATSALDSRSERLVQAGLEELMADRTSIIIAHRLSTISTVDRIITLRDGRIDEVGSPAELAETDGIYAELLALQESGTKRDKRRLAAFDITG